MKVTSVTGGANIMAACFMVAEGSFYVAALNLVVGIVCILDGARG